jgi:hypothetical protein
MMKTVQAVGKYEVSFNIFISEYEVGESDMNTVDYAADDIDELAAEVIAGDPSYPMIFELTEDDNFVVGVFRDAKEPQYVVAVMYCS